MMGIRILLIARKGETRKKYQEAITDLGVEVVAVSSLKKTDRGLMDLSYHGVMVDMRTKIQILKDENEWVYTALRKFPVAHLNLESKTGEIRLFYPGQKAGATLEDFVNRECRPFTPRILSSRVRKQIHFNVVLSENKEFSSEHCERTVTVYISSVGCFVFSVGDWKPGDSAWLSIKELRDNTPICALVRWCLKWGEGMRVPGIGLEFAEITESQAKEIYDRLWL
jgi:hypothetical protein